MAKQELAPIELPLFFVLVGQTAGGEEIQEQAEKLHQDVDIGGHAKE